MRINTLKCEMEPAVAALQAELSIESVVATQSITNSHPQRYVCLYVCVCVFAIAPTCHCAARHKLAPQSSKSRSRSCSYGALHSTDFSIKIQIDANKWPSPIPQRVSETLNCSCTTRPSPSTGGGRGRQGGTPRKSRFRPRINKLKFCPQLDNGNANAPESLISLFQ